MGKSFEVDANPAAIRYAREEIGYTIEEIVKKAKIGSVERYKKIESGDIKPTFSEIKRLSECLKRPIAFFFLPEIPKEEKLFVDFRSFVKAMPTPQKKVNKVINEIKKYYMVIKDLSEELEEIKFFKIPQYTLNENPKEVARIERERLGINIEIQKKWKNAYEAFDGWRDRIENENIFVFLYSAELKEGRGLSICNEPPFIIAINSKDNILARIFTLFHEYAHILLRKSYIDVEELEVEDEKSEVEGWVNIFTSEFLLPEDILKNDEIFEILIKEDLNSDSFWDNLTKLSKRYKLSRKALLTKFKKMGIFSEEKYRNALAILEKREKISEKEKGWRPLTQSEKCLKLRGKNYVSLILKSLNKKIINTYDALEYLSIKHENLSDLYNLIG